ncbi:hypothetical protein Tco_1305312, partial [Tanacetum coccineum]
MDPSIVMCKNSGHGEDGEKIMELGTMDMDGSATEKMDNGDDGREGDEGTRLKIKIYPNEKDEESKHEDPEEEEEEEDNRWSLQEEIGKLLKHCLQYGLCHWDKGVSCSISRCSKQADDDGDYICTSVIDIWPDIKKTHPFTGPSHAALMVVHELYYRDDVIESSFVYGPGVLQFKLSSKWIAKLKRMMTEFLIERFPDGEVKYQAIGDLE